MRCPTTKHPAREVPREALGAGPIHVVVSRPAVRSGCFLASWTADNPSTRGSVGGPRSPVFVSLRHSSALWPPSRPCSTVRGVDARRAAREGRHGPCHLRCFPSSTCSRSLLFPSPSLAISSRSPFLPSPRVRARPSQSSLHTLRAASRSFSQLLPAPLSLSPFFLPDLCVLLFPPCFDL